MKTCTLAFASLLLLPAVAVAQTTPPALVNYQGVLRDAADKPLTGTYDMIFRFWSADVGGSEILIDQHTAVLGAPVTITGGLFNVLLGGGAVSDGSGAGVYTSLTQVFRDYPSIWMSIQVGAETLSPRIRILAAGYALNSDHLDGKQSTDFANSIHTHAGSDITSMVSNSDMIDGHHGSYFVDTSSTSQTKYGTLRAQAGSGYGIEGTGPTAGGYFADSNGTGYAYVGHGNYGILANGSDYGGYFDNTQNTSWAALAWGSDGISAHGNTQGGYFQDDNSSGRAHLAYGDAGIEATGSSYGGYFGETDSSGQAWLASTDAGIDAKGGWVGGRFQDVSSGQTAWALVGHEGDGIEAQGSHAGGYFRDTDGSGYGHVGFGDVGIEARGNSAGGYFVQANSTDNYAYLGYGSENGVYAKGVRRGGYFFNATGSGRASIGGIDDVGIDARASLTAGLFANSARSAEARLGHRGSYTGGEPWYAAGYFSFGSAYARLAWDASTDASGQWIGVYGSGTVSGGDFYSPNHGIWVTSDWEPGVFIHYPNNNTTIVADGVTKVSGNGVPTFVQNHPYEKDKVVVYASPEGDEAATFTRGTARLSAGVARVPLGETFKWVTNPDVGLTAYVSPRGETAGLFVESIGTDEIVVREASGGTSDVAFDYFVWGLRIGFEEMNVVKPKIREMYIPGMGGELALYQSAPELRRFNALQRHTSMAATSGVAASIDLSRAHALRAAIHEFDPALDHPVKGPYDAAELVRAESQARAASAASAESSAPVPAGGATAAGPSTVAVIATRAPASGEEGAESATDPARCVPVSEPVEPGDVLALDPLHLGQLMRARTAEDPGVVGIAAGPSEVIDGQHQAPLAQRSFATIRADASFGVILPGDLLTTSVNPGFAMKAATGAPGTIVAKALEPLEAGTGLIKVLVMSR